jgi:hypothetical protein
VVIILLVFLKVREFLDYTTHLLFLKNDSAPCGYMYSLVSGFLSLITCEIEILFFGRVIGSSVAWSVQFACGLEATEFVLTGSQ